MKRQFRWLSRFNSIDFTNLSDTLIAEPVDWRGDHRTHPVANPATYTETQEIPVCLQPKGQHETATHRSSQPRR